MNTIKKFLVADAKRTSGEWRDPTPEELESPLFEAIWQVVKTWDINVPHAYNGYCGATGNHVAAIIDGIAPAIRTMLADIEIAREALHECETWQEGTGRQKNAIRLRDKALSALDKYKGGV